MKKRSDTPLYILNQFIKVGDASIIANEGAYLLCTRGAAMRGYENMAAANLVIPVWIRGNGNRHQWSMSAIFIQMKNWLYEDATLVNAEDFSPSDVKGYQELLDISIAMEFPMGGSREGLPPDEIKLTSNEPDEKSHSPALRDIHRGTFETRL